MHFQKNLGVYVARSRAKTVMEGKCLWNSRAKAAGSTTDPDLVEIAEVDWIYDGGVPGGLVDREEKPRKEDGKGGKSRGW